MFQNERPVHIWFALVIRLLYDEKTNGNYETAVFKEKEKEREQKRPSVIYLRISVEGLPRLPVAMSRSKPTWQCTTFTQYRFGVFLLIAVALASSSAAPSSIHPSIQAAAPGGKMVNLLLVVVLGSERIGCYYTRSGRGHRRRGRGCRENCPSGSGETTRFHSRHRRRPIIVCGVFLSTNDKLAPAAQWKLFFRGASRVGVGKLSLVSRHFRWMWWLYANVTQQQQQSFESHITQENVKSCTVLNSRRWWLAVNTTEIFTFRKFKKN